MTFAHDISAIVCGGFDTHDRIVLAIGAQARDRVEVDAWATVRGAGRARERLSR